MDDKLPLELRTERFTLKEVFPARAKKYAQKLHRKADELEFVRKGIPIDPADISIDDGERAAIRLVTTPRLDRDGEILLPDGAVLDDFRQSPSVFWAHDYQRLPVGHDAWIKIDKRGIIGKTLYANHQFAEDVFQCVKHGDLSSNSVGFIPVEWVGPTDKGFKAVADLLERDYDVPKDEIAKARRVYTKWIMLEHSDVGVPSNPHALNLAVSKGELNLCDSLKHDLGLDVETKAEADSVTEPESGASEETKGETEVETKILDTEGNPSTSDLWGAIDRALNGVSPIPEGTPWCAINELFPVDFPNGHCIYTEYLQGREVNPKYQQDYTFADGNATLTGDRVEVVISYTEKAAPESAPETKDAPIDPPVGETASLTSMLQAINARLDGIEARLAPPPPVSPTSENAPVTETPVPADIIDIEPEPDVLAGLDFTPAPTPPKSMEAMTEAQVIEAVGKAIAGLDLSKQIKELVDLALDKARGRVR